MTINMFLFLAIFFVLGLIFGSFGSVISSRLADFSFSDIFGSAENKAHKKRKEAIQTILRWRSQCPSCKHTLHTKDLIPLVSYISTGGKCRYCKKKISPIYVWREIGCGLLFVVLGGLVLSQTWGVSLTICILWLLLIRTSYLLLIHDVETMNLHEPLRLLTALLSLLFVANLPGSLFGQTNAVAWFGGRYYALVFGLVFLGFFLAFYWFARWYVARRLKRDNVSLWFDGEWFGSGDVWVAPLLGIQFGAREYFLQVQSITNLEGFSRVLAIEHFSYYIILAGVLCLIYAGLQKLYKPSKSIRQLPFFAGMITAIWAIMILTHIWMI